MQTNEAIRYCKSCGKAGTGKFCGSCGQSYDVKRITVKGLLHDVFHFFTHLEKGFGYTLKRLVTAPGTMQREYVEGNRHRYQKPFSMFFVCLTFNGLLRYFIDELLIRFFNDPGLAAEARFRHELQFVSFVMLVPVITLLAWLVFRSRKYNYAETGVMQLYMLSFLLAATAVIPLLKFIFHTLDTAYIDLPLFVLYSSFTAVHFYNDSKRGVVIVKNIFLTVAFFMLFQLVEDYAIGLLK